jgi:bile acid:Na+ symporter, BASS family
MLLALAVGLMWGRGAHWLESLMLPALAVVMTLSTLSVSGAAFRSLRATALPALLGLGFSYLIHGGVLLALNALLIRERDLWTGFVILASVPPAVAVIPYSVFLKGNTNFSLMGTVGSYVGALVVTPVWLATLLGTGFMDPLKLLVVLLELIVGPLVLSRVLLRTGLAQVIQPTKGAITNWSFFLVIYVMVGLNREVFLQSPQQLVPVVIISILSTFFLGWLIEYVAGRIGVKSSTTISLVLLGTFKNYGLAGGLSLVFFNAQSAVPTTVTSVISVLYIIWLEFKGRKRAMTEP